MIVLNWGYCKAHIWLGELPTWSYEATEVAERHREALDVKVAEMRSAAVELLVPVGARVYYGGLGAEFVPKPVEQLVVQVPISVDEGQLLSDSLAGRLDRVHLGLPHEFAGGVLDTIMNTNSTQLLGTGILRFCRAVHSSIGSSVWFFGILSKIIGKLLILDMQSSSEEHLLELIRLELRHR